MQARPGQDVFPRIPETRDTIREGRLQGRYGKTTGLEPFRDRLGSLPIADAVRPGRCRLRVRKVLVRQHGNGETLLKCEDPRQFPAAGQGVGDTAVTQVSLPPPEGQQPNAADGQPLLDAEVRHAVVRPGVVIVLGEVLEVRVPPFKSITLL